MTGPTLVVAAVIERDGAFLVARRPRGTHLAGLWEFPGGKVHEGESLEVALRREILEELNATIDGLEEVFQTSHLYPDRAIELHFFRGRLGGHPEPALGQELRWVRREDFARLEFPPADAELIASLTHSRV